MFVLITFAYSPSKNVIEMLYIANYELATMNNIVETFQCHDIIDEHFRNVA